MLYKNTEIIATTSKNIIFRNKIKTNICSHQDLHGVFLRREVATKWLFEHRLGLYIQLINLLAARKYWKKGSQEKNFVEEDVFVSFHLYVSRLSYYSRAVANRQTCF